MRWKTKALIQNAVDCLPSAASYATYYWLQRYCGQLRQYNPMSRFNGAIETWKRIQEQSGSPAGAVFFEVGTGRVPTIPLAFWLMGAEQAITVDLNRYLAPDLVTECLRHISSHEAEFASLFGPLLNQKRCEELLAFARRSAPRAAQFLELCHIHYIAPGDAAHTHLPAHSIDFHTSFTVLEHIPPGVLPRILEEGNRLIRDQGLFVHCIDYSDHFSHDDPAISAINFLQFSDAQWRRFADNRYMYMNRLRHDDFLHLFESAGHRILKAEPDVDQGSLTLLKSESMRLDMRFRSRPRDMLAIRGAWLVSRLK